MFVCYENYSNSLDILVYAIFPNLNSPLEYILGMLNQIILAPKNTFFDTINNILIQKLSSEVRQYYNFDEIIDASEHEIMKDFLNTLTLNNFPSHELFLQHNYSIMLSRNLDHLKGLCNDKHLICHGFDRNLINTKILVDNHTGKGVLFQQFCSYQILFKALDSHSSRLNFL